MPIVRLIYDQSDIMILLMHPDADFCKNVTKIVLTKCTWATFIHVIRVYSIKYDRDFVVFGFGFVIS